MRHRRVGFDVPFVREDAVDEWGYRLSGALAIHRRRISAAMDVATRALSRLTGRSEWRFVTGSAGLLALWVADLPASERHHDSHPFGLLEHSADVAAEVARDLDRRWNGEQGGRVLSDAERSMWARVAYATALLHDVGKVLDVVVAESGGEGEWNPLCEPLALFKRRWKIRFGDPSPYRYRARRGMWGHEANGAAVARAILSASAWEGLGPLILATLSAYTGRCRAADPGLPVPLGYLAIRVHEADVAVSRLAWRKRGPAVGARTWGEPS